MEILQNGVHTKWEAALTNEYCFLNGTVLKSLPCVFAVDGTC